MEPSDSTRQVSINSFTRDKLFLQYITANNTSKSEHRRRKAHIGKYEEAKLLHIYLNFANDSVNAAKLYRSTASETGTVIHTCYLNMCESMTQLRPMTLAPETGAINQLHFLEPLFGATFLYHIRME